MKWFQFSLENNVSLFALWSLNMKISVVSVFVSNIYNCILLSYFFVLHYNFILDIVDFILGDLSVFVCKPHPADRVCAVQLFGFYKFCRRSSLVSTSLSKTLQTPFLQNYTTETHTDKQMFPSHQRAFFPTAISRRITVSCPSKGSEPSQCDNVSKCIVKYETVKWLIDIFVFRWLKNINILLEVAISMSWMEIQRNRLDFAENI